MALVVGVFAAGIVVGVLGTHLYFAHRGYGRAAASSEAFAEHMRERLALGQDQTRAIAAIMRETFEEAHKLHEQMHPQVRALMERSAQRIEEVLTAEQRVEFEKLRKEHDKGADFFLLGRGPMPPWIEHGPPGTPPAHGPDTPEP
jgi:hypothetical protein